MAAEVCTCVGIHLWILQRNTFEENLRGNKLIDKCLPPCFRWENTGRIGDLNHRCSKSTEVACLSQTIMSPIRFHLEMAVSYLIECDTRVFNESICLYYSRPTQFHEDWTCRLGWFRPPVVGTREWPVSLELSKWRTCDHWFNWWCGKRQCWIIAITYATS